jgi:hypothetical protein
MRDLATSTREQRDAVTTLLCDELEKGLSVRVACDKVGISQAAIHRWKQRAEAGDDEAIQLVRRLVAARAIGFDKHVGKIKAAADDDWRAAAWIVDKLYPNWTGQVEELVLREAEQDDHLTKEYAQPRNWREVVLQAVELGLVTIDELTAVAPKPEQQLARAEQPQPRQQDPLVPIMQACYVALQLHGPQDLEELTQLLCRTFRCDQQQVAEAYNRAGVEVLDAGSPGRRPRIQWPERPHDPPRTIEKVVAPEAESSRTEEPADPSANPRPEGGDWFDGPARGTGDMIRERRG